MGCATSKATTLAVDGIHLDSASVVKLDAVARRDSALASTTDPWAVLGPDVFLLVLHHAAFNDESRALRALSAVAAHWRDSACSLAADLRALGRAPPPPGRFSVHLRRTNGGPTLVADLLLRVMVELRADGSARLEEAEEMLPNGPFAGFTYRRESLRAFTVRDGTLLRFAPGAVDVSATPASPRDASSVPAFDCRLVPGGAEARTLQPLDWRFPVLGKHYDDPLPPLTEEWGSRFGALFAPGRAVADDEDSQYRAEDDLDYTWDYPDVLP